MGAVVLSNTMLYAGHSTEAMLKGVAKTSLGLGTKNEGYPPFALLHLMIKFI